MKAIGRGTIALMMNGYIALGPTFAGSSSIISSDGKGWFCLDPGFHPGFGGSTLRMPGCLTSGNYDFLRSGPPMGICFDCQLSMEIKSEGNYLRK